MHASHGFLIGKSPVRVDLGEMQTSLKKISQLEGKGLEPIKVGVASIQSLSHFIAEFNGKGKREWLGCIPKVSEAACQLNKIFSDIIFIKMKGYFDVSTNTIFSKPDPIEMQSRQNALEGDSGAKSVLSEFGKLMTLIKGIFAYIEETAQAQQFGELKLNDKINTGSTSALIYETLTTQKEGKQRFEELKKELEQYKNLLGRIESVYTTTAFGIHFIDSELS